MNARREPSGAAVTALLLFIVGALCLLCDAIASAQGGGHVERELAMLLARTAAHEGAIQNARDLDLVWQVVQDNADTTAKRLAFLRAHCPQVAGTRECRENCWSVSITGGVLPAGVAAGEQGYWRHVVLPRYQALERRAAALVRGAKYEKPCAGNPVTWGSPTLDHDRAVRLGMKQHVCRGTLNEAWSY